MTAETILALARKELGTAESPAGSNHVKYNTAYYGREVSGGAYPWCCVFLWWLFQTAGAPELFYGGGRTASCSALMTYAKSHGPVSYTHLDVYKRQAIGKALQLSLTRKRS